MQVDIPPILWHDEQNKIMSIDFYPNSDKHFATASYVTDGDAGIRFWELKTKPPRSFLSKEQIDSGSEPKGNLKVEPQYLYDLHGGHQKSVNCVRFAPNGLYLASGADDQLVIIWTLKSVPVEFGKLDEQIQWGQPRQLRGHVGDVMDLCWSNDSNHLVSGSLDGSAILWSITPNKFGKVQTFEGHKKFVQGVTMHPSMKLIATASSDATVRIYKNRKLKNQQQFFHKFTIKQREELEEKSAQDIKATPDSHKIENPQQSQADDQIMVDDSAQQQMDENKHEENQIVSKDAKERSSGQPPSTAAEIKKKSHRLFLDDTEYTSFVRRLSFSPDGNFMLCPGSWYQDLSAQSTSDKFQYAVYGFIKNSINRPSFMLPGMKSHANCIRFCPLLLKLKELNDDDPKPMIDLPYRMAFAIATIDHVLIYTTQCIYPLAVIKNIHYDSINDLAWVGSKMLAVASSDGFCSFVQVDANLVGEPLPNDSELIPECLREHYQSLSQVDFEKNVSLAMQNKSSGFSKITFKSKKFQNQQEEKPKEAPGQLSPQSAPPSNAQAFNNDDDRLPDAIPGVKKEDFAIQPRSSLENSQTNAIDITVNNPAQPPADQDIEMN